MDNSKTVISLTNLAEFKSEMDTAVDEKLSAGITENLADNINFATSEQIQALFA